MFPPGARAIFVFIVPSDVPPDPRRRLAVRLDRVEDALIGMMRVLLAPIAAAALVGLGFVVLRMPEGGGSQGEWFYAAAFLVLVLFLVFGQYTKLQRRISRRRDRSGLAEGMETFRKSLNVSFGSVEPQASDVSGRSAQPRTFNISFGATEPQILRLDRAQIDEARYQLQRGRDLEDVMAEVVPEYPRLNVIEKRLYRAALNAALKAES